MCINEQSGRGASRHVAVPSSTTADEVVLTFVAEIALASGGLVTAGITTSKEIP